MREPTLDVAGMTCASCVSGVQNALNELDGVQARVNLATEQAHAAGAAMALSSVAVVLNSLHRRRLPLTWPPLDQGIRPGRTRFLDQREDSRRRASSGFVPRTGRPRRVSSPRGAFEAAAP